MGGEVDNLRASVDKLRDSGELILQAYKESALQRSPISFANIGAPVKRRASADRGPWQISDLHFPTRP
jgi:hypothetical protein